MYKRENGCQVRVEGLWALFLQSHLSYYIVFPIQESFIIKKHQLSDKVFQTPGGPRCLEFTVEISGHGYSSSSSVTYKGHIN